MTKNTQNLLAMNSKCSSCSYNSNTWTQWTIVIFFLTTSLGRIWPDFKSFKTNVIVSYISRLDHVMLLPLLTELHWLSVADRITFKTLLCVYKSLNGLCPQYMFDCLVVNSSRPGSVTTRSHHGLNLKVPKTRKCAGDRAYLVAAPRLWNISLQRTLCS